jgi:hypothetical protein
MGAACTWVRHGRCTPGSHHRQPQRLTTGVPILLAIQDDRGELPRSAPNEGGGEEFECPPSGRSWMFSGGIHNRRRDPKPTLRKPSGRRLKQPLPHRLPKTSPQNTTQRQPELLLGTVTGNEILTLPAARPVMSRRVPAIPLMLMGSMPMLVPAGLLMCPSPPTEPPLHSSRADRLCPLPRVASMRRDQRSPPRIPGRFSVEKKATPAAVRAPCAFHCETARNDAMQ